MNIKNMANGPNFDEYCPLKYYFDILYLYIMFFSSFFFKINILFVLKFNLIVHVAITIDSCGTGSFADETLCDSTIQRIDSFTVVGSRQVSHGCLWQTGSRKMHTIYLQI